MKVFLTYILLLISTLGLAQSAFIHGKVYDAEGKPLVGAQIIVNSNASLSTLTNSYGIYRLQVPSGVVLEVRTSYAKNIQRNTIALLDEGQDYLLNIDMLAVNLRAVDITSKREPKDSFIVPIIIDPKKTIELTNAGSFEQLLTRIILGANNTNELGSGYNVRGGNFDENLVYVNDIEVYRPFLARSGQQEGLSVINPALIDNIVFSAGGFEAKYGDKLSSALDITYTKPDSFQASAELSLLGTNVHFEGIDKRKRFTYLVGARYRSNQYLLGSLDVQGDYKPRFFDIQSLLSYRINSETTLSLLTAVSQNRYKVVPQNRSTNFGTVKDAFQLNIAFGGAELMQYTTIMNGLSLVYKPYKTGLVLKFITSAYNTQEREHFTIEGAYRLDELDVNLGSSNFANAKNTLGNGYFIDHARNDLVANVFSAQHKGTYTKKKLGEISWGVRWKHERITDVLKEWRYNDSSGYNVGNVDTGDNYEIILDEYLKADISILSHRYMGYVQHSTTLTRSKDVTLKYGIRSNYWTFNGENVISPRVQITFQPHKQFNDSIKSLYRQLFRFSNDPRIGWLDSNSKKEWLLKASAGYYYQPPFYRELRDPQGNINPNLKAQRSVHFVVGSDLNFKVWGRKFKFLTEAYYKYLDRLVPYVIDDVRIRYLAENSSQGYATGIDARVNGEFISGIESWINVSLLKTQERIYYKDEDGVEQLSDWLRRSTDQRFNFSILFQDELPSNPSYKMNVNIVYGSRIPFYFNSDNRYSPGFTIPAYRRVDIGFSKVLIDPNKKHREKYKNVKSLWMSLEVFNLLQVNNTISFLLIKDFSNNVFGVPNYLTGRRINLRFILRI